MTGWPAVVGEALKGVQQQGSYARRDVCVVEEADGVAVLGGVGAPVMHLLEVGCELCLPEYALRHIGVGAYDIPPSREIGSGAGWRGRRVIRLFGLGVGRSARLRLLRGNGEQRIAYILDFALLVGRVYSAQRIGDVEQACPCELRVDVLRAGVSRLVARFLDEP